MDFKVIEIGSAKFKRSHKNNCNHRGTLEYDPNAETVTCVKCELILNNFKAFMILVEAYGQDKENRMREIQRLEQLKEETLIFRAAKRIESAWRSRDMVPVCPHCLAAIFPEDGFGGSMTNKKMEIKRRNLK